MKKSIVGLGIALVAVLVSLGLVGPAAGYGGQDSSGGTTPGGVAESGAGVLPATGGPETLMLIAGLALLLVGAVALFVSRRRAHA